MRLLCGVNFLGTGRVALGRGVGAYLSYDKMYILELSLMQVSNTSKFELGPRHQSGFNVHLRDLFFSCCSPGLSDSRRLIFVFLRGPVKNSSKGQWTF